MIFDAKYFKTQKTTLGYNAKDILKRVRVEKTMGGFKRRVFLLGHGMFNRHFNFIRNNPTHLVIQSGQVRYKILK